MAGERISYCAVIDIFASFGCSRIQIYFARFKIAIDNTKRATHVWIS